MKKTLSLFLAVCISFCLCACGEVEDEQSSGLMIVAANFPAYDFAREISGGRADVCLLVPPGSEAHSFEPTAKDIFRIENCDLLVCSGGEGEVWLEKVLNGIDREIEVLKMLDCVDALEEEVREGMQSKEHSHEEHEGHGRHDEHEEEEHELEYDEHVWTSPVNARLICKAICDELCRIDAENEEYYTGNCLSYCEKLSELDAQFRQITDSAKNRTVIFADRFPVRYFVEEYGLDYYAAFPGCAEDTEPSAKTVAFLIDRVKQYHTPAVFYIEFSNEKMADIICEDTGCQKLLFHSCHNVSADDISSGVSYLDLMVGNAENLRRALN